ncbi:MAG: HNH endonuclease [Planctomycetaceae bacterium]|jgi:hypothetical protein
MLSIPPPTITANDAFAKCISIVRDKALKRRFQSVAAFINKADVTYQQHARDRILHLLMAETKVGGVVTTDEMKALYESRMVRQKTPGRDIYDLLLSNAPRGLCPLCAHRNADTLDHHLPKTQFPSLAITPANLIPACGKCNEEKLDKVPTSDDSQTLHPYFDDIDDDVWLSARVVEMKPTAAVFSVSPPGKWSESQKSRVSYHFKALKLGALYSAQAANELAAIQHRLKKLFRSGGAEFVRNHLREDAESREVDRRNSWMSAAYRAWANSDWFCNDGFS